jgi:hypothetical protein
MIRGALLLSRELHPRRLHRTPDPTDEAHLEVLYPRLANNVNEAEIALNTK